MLNNNNKIPVVYVYFETIWILTELALWATSKLMENFWSYWSGFPQVFSTEVVNVESVVEYA